MKKIGQAEIQKILQKNNSRCISTVEIAKALKQTTSVVVRALNTMFRYREVSRVKLDGVFYWKLKKYNSFKAHVVFIQN